MINLFKIITQEWLPLFFAVFGVSLPIWSLIGSICTHRERERERERDGYGTASDGGSYYWVIKNLGGADWGEDGCLRYLQGMDDKEGLCMSKCNITVNYEFDFFNMSPAPYLLDR